MSAIGPSGIDYAKHFVTEAIDLLTIPHLESVHKVTLDVDLLNLIINIGVMSEQVKTAQTPIFTKKEIDEIIIKTLTILVDWNPNISTQLELFLNAHTEIGKISYENPHLPPYSPLLHVEQNFERVRDAHKDFVDLIKSFNTKIIDTIQLRALLLSFVGKMETVVHSFEEQFIELLKDFGLQNNYDVPQIFSVNEKVRRNTIYQTDALAVRDAITHTKFKINKIGDLWEIEFNNNEKGWNFTRKYSYEEFISFLDNNHKMFVSQLMIVQTIGVNSYLKKYLMK
jgi:hypothetical protein